MKQITIKDIRSLNPCYDPNRYLYENWSGTVLDILKINQVPIADRLWVALREDFIPKKKLRKFAIWCATQACEYISDSEKLCYLNILEIIDQYNNGEQSEEIRDAAGAAAWDAARAAAWDAAGAAAWAAAWDAARAAAWDAACGAARAAAWAAAWDAASGAACGAARAAAWDAAWDAVSGAASGAARDAQLKYLIKLLSHA